MSKKTKNFLLVSFVIPTFNSERYLAGCLTSISKQSYPRKKMEILIIDGGSKDKTVKIARAFGAKILKNPHRDAESGKSIGIRKAKGTIICLLDSDNEIVHTNWLEEMVKPLLRHNDVWGVESPWLLKKDDNLINKYFTLLQIADPIARRFHPPKMKKKAFGNYVVYETADKVPVVGANGFLWRKSFIKKIGEHIPKFEEVNYVSKMMRGGYYRFARVKNVGIHHYYCDSIRAYIIKRLKIGRKFLERKTKKQPTWTDRVRPIEFLNSALYSIFIIGPVIESIKEYKKSKEIAWFLHPLFSLLTVAVYFYTILELPFRKIPK